MTAAKVVRTSASRYRGRESCLGKSASLPSLRPSLRPSRASPPTLRQAPPSQAKLGFSTPSSAVSAPSRRARARCLPLLPPPSSRGLSLVLSRPGLRQVRHPRRPRLRSSRSLSPPPPPPPPARREWVPERGAVTTLPCPLSDAAGCCARSDVRQWRRSGAETRREQQGGQGHRSAAARPRLAARTATRAMSTRRGRRTYLGATRSTWTPLRCSRGVTFWGSLSRRSHKQQQRHPEPTGVSQEPLDPGDVEFDVLCRKLGVSFLSPPPPNPGPPVRCPPSCCAVVVPPQ